MSAVRLMDGDAVRGLDLKAVGHFTEHGHLCDVTIRQGVQGQ
jgi:hypothetical protein